MRVFKDFIRCVVRVKIKLGVVFLIEVYRLCRFKLFVVAVGVNLMDLRNNFLKINVNINKNIWLELKIFIKF